MSGLLSLKWNNHSRIFLHVLQNLRVKELYCDTTIVCQGKFYPVHRLVLSTCSEYFKEIFERSPCKHPFIILKDVHPVELEVLLNYMYKGEVDVLHDSLSDVVKTAEALQIKGLAVPDDDAQNLLSQIEYANNSKEQFNQCPINDSNLNNDIDPNNENNQVHYEASNNIVTDETEQNLNSEQQQPLIEETYNRFSASKRSISPSENVSIDPNLLKVEFNEGSEDIPMREETLLEIEFNEGSGNVTRREERLLEERVLLKKNELATANSKEEIIWNTGTPSIAGTSGQQNMNVNKDLKEIIDQSQKNVYDNLLKVNLNPRRVGNVFVCPACSLRSTHRTSMKRHILRKHTLERPHGCEYCSYRAATKDTVAEHTIRLHSNNVFKCTHCNYSTKLRRFLFRHIRKVHKIEPQI